MTISTAHYNRVHLSKMAIGSFRSQVACVPPQIAANEMRRALRNRDHTETEFWTGGQWFVSSHWRGQPYALDIRGRHVVGAIREPIELQPWPEGEEL